MKFCYTILVNQDNVILQVKGICDGVNEDAVRAELEGRGLQVLDIREMDQYDIRINRLKVFKEALSRKHRGDTIVPIVPVKVSWWQRWKRLWTK